MADHALNVAQSQKRAWLVNRLVERTQDKAFGVSNNGSTSPESDDMGVHVGDTLNHHYPPPPQGMGTLAKLAIAGLAATGIGLPVGLGLALPAILDYLKPPPPVVSPEPQPETPPVVVVPPAGDSGLLYDLRLEK